MENQSAAQLELMPSDPSFKVPPDQIQFQKGSEKSRLQARRLQRRAGERCQATSAVSPGESIPPHVALNAEDDSYITNSKISFLSFKSFAAIFLAIRITRLKLQSTRAQDIFTTLVDAQWRWTLLVFSMNFLLSWLGFALVWWLIAYSHGDLEPQNFNGQNFTPCVEDIRSFTSCFLFSVETQHTIGLVELYVALLLYPRASIA